MSSNLKLHSNEIILSSSQSYCENQIIPVRILINVMTMYWVHATCQMFLFLCFDTPNFPQGRNDCSHITNEESKKKVSCFLMLHSKWPNLDFVVQGQVFLHYAGLLCFMTYCLKAFCKPWSTIWRVLSMVVIIVSQQASSWICAPHCSLTLNLTFNLCLLP